MDKPRRVFSPDETSPGPTDSAAPRDRHLREILEILADVMRNRAVAVYLFGSRATGTNGPVSDYDIAVSSPDDIATELAHARERLEDSNIPFKIDLVDLGLTDAGFAHKVQERGVLLWRS